MSTPSTSPHIPRGINPYGFANIADYIEQITYAIWNLPGRDPELVHRHYGPTTAIYADAGDLVGDASVTANTQARLRAFPDFHGVIDDTIWVGDEDTGYRTSMRWTWTATNTGPSVFGPPTGRKVRYSAIANCVVRGEVIIEEWLASNPLALGRQLGLDQQEAVERWANAGAAPASGTRPAWHSDAHGPGLRVAELWDAALNDGDLEVIRIGYHPRATQWHGAGVGRSTPTQIVSWFRGWHELLSDLAWVVDDSYWLPGAAGEPHRVATQWTLRGRHGDRPVHIAGISHQHVRDNLVVAEWNEYDALALLRQCGHQI